MKRYFIFLLLLALMIPAMIVPAAASQQGVIDAIEDQTDTLGEWLGVGLGEIRDYCAWIYESLVDWYSDQSSWINDIWTSLESIKESLVGDPDETNPLEEDLIPIETQIDEWIDDIETAPTISIDDVVTEVGKVTNTEIEPGFYSFLNVFFSSGVFSVVMIWVFVLAILSFILYGKR